MKMLRRSMNTVFEDSNDGLLNHTGSSSNLLDRDVSSAKQTKRYRIFCELLETEQNYVDVLKCILRNYRDEFYALQEHERDAILNKHEQKMLFGRIENLLKLHEAILNTFENENHAWTGKNLIGYVFTHNKESMMKYYPPYINAYDEMNEIINRVLMNPVAQQFFKSCELNTPKRFSIKDLLIRPVQRLPSITLLLKELLKQTPKSNPDYPCIKLALETVDQVLSKSNESRCETDNHQQTLEIINGIDQFPPDQIHSKSQFRCQADFQLVHSNANGSFKKLRGSILTFFLFSDMLIIAKRRDHISPAYHPNQSRLNISNQNLNTSFSNLSRSSLIRSGSVSTLKRSISFISNIANSNIAKPDRKPFKFLEIKFFTSFRQFMFNQQEGVFYLKLRDEMADEWSTLKVAADTTFEIAYELLEELCNLINTTTNREVALVDYLHLANKQMHDPLIQDDLEYVRKTRFVPKFEMNCISFLFSRRKASLI